MHAAGNIMKHMFHLIEGSGEYKPSALMKREEGRGRWKMDDKTFERKAH